MLTHHCGEPGEQTPCLIDDDLIVNGSSTITIVGIISVTGDVKITDNVKVKIPAGSELHVGRCLILEDESMITVVVSDGEKKMSNGSVVLSYDSSCSSPNLINRVKIESNSLDECRDGEPVLIEQLEGGEQSGRIQLVLVYLPVDSDECKSKMNVVAVAVAVPIALLFIFIVVVILVVPFARKKVLQPAFRSCFKRQK